jgi:hypothetical protein
MNKRQIERLTSNKSHLMGLKKRVTNCNRMEEVRASHGKRKTKA